MNTYKSLTATILVLPFCMALLTESVMSADVTGTEFNNTISTAQNIDNDFSLGDNLDIHNSAVWPWVSISVDGDGTHDYYVFDVPTAGVTGLFDIDYGYFQGGSVDTEICLYASDGTVIASNDDSNESLGAGGSIYSRDSFIEYVFAAPGTYVISVGEYDTFCNPGGVGGNAPDAGDTYELQISLSQHGMDSDVDGLADNEDCNPYSDLNPTVMFDDCDSGIANTWFNNGCTIADQIHACADKADNHGRYSRCVAAVADHLISNGEILSSGKGMILSCATQSDTGK